MICTTNTGGADIVRDGLDGFIVPIRDVEALKEKILFSLNTVRPARLWGSRPAGGCKAGLPGRITAIK